MALIGALPVVASAIHLGVVSAGKTYRAEDAPARGVVMVLGAKANPGSASAFLAARLDVAIGLYEAGKANAVLVSGDGLARSNFETAVMRDYLVARGIPADRIVEDPAGFDTYDSCVRARDVFGVTDLTLVTQDYHVGRAVAICELVGVDAVGVADVSMLRRFPLNWIKGAGREWLANLKVEWDVWSERTPQQDPPDPSLRNAAKCR